MRIRLRTFQGDAKQVDLPASLEALHALIRTQFSKPNAEVTVLRHGRTVASDQELAELQFPEGGNADNFLVVAFGKLPEIQKQEANVAAQQVGHGDSDQSGSALDRPEVQAMFNDAKFKKMKERFRSNPSAWQAIYEELLRDFPAAMAICSSDKDALKKMMSKTDFGGDDGVQYTEEKEAEAEQEEREFSPLEMEEISTLMGMGYTKDQVLTAYTESKHDVDTAAKLLAQDV